MKLNELKIGDKILFNYKNNICTGYLLDSAEFTHTRVQFCVGDCFSGIPPCEVIWSSDIISKIVEKVTREETPIEHVPNTFSTPLTPYSISYTADDYYFTWRPYVTEMTASTPDGGTISMKLPYKVNFRPDIKYKMTIEEVK